MNALVQTSETSLPVWRPQSPAAAKSVGRAVCAFLDVATTSFGRATHYNERIEQQDAELAVHDALFRESRDIYAVLLGLEGLADRARQVGLKKLLSTSRAQDGLITADQERRVLSALLLELPPQRLLKLLDALRQGDEGLGIRKANNARTRKLILRTLLSSQKLPLWSVKYRTKVASALRHAWGEGLAGVIRAILRKEPGARDAKENSILRANVGKHVGGDVGKLSAALQAVGFALGVRDRLELPLLRAFVDAKTDLSRGAKLPPEVLEGLRGTYHKSTPKEEVVRLTKDALTSGQRLAVQKRAKAAGAEVKVREEDLLAQDAVRLYLYAFETGMTPEVRSALDEKAQRAAARFPARYGSVAVIVDASASMEGDQTQRLRPMAATLALRDMLMKTAPRGLCLLAGGAPDAESGLVRPQGETQLASMLVAALDCEDGEAPEAVFVLSDGYENAPAGRFAEAVEQVRALGVETPIYHLNPVMAAEAKGVKELAPGLAPTLPARDPAALAPAMIRGLIEADPERGVNALLRTAFSQSKALAAPSAAAQEGVEP